MANKRISRRNAGGKRVRTRQGAQTAPVQDATIASENGAADTAHVIPFRAPQRSTAKISRLSPCRPTPAQAAEQGVLAWKHSLAAAATSRESELELENARLRRLLDDLLLQRVKLQRAARR
jgi:hypothetical protein